MSRCAFFLIFLVMPYSHRAQAKTPKDMRKSAQDFVRQFYNWYVSVAAKENTGPPSDLALKYRSNVFSRKLFRALKKDSDASKKASGEIVGLDFDPFLASQDPGKRYQVGKVTREGDSYRVEVFGVWSGKKSAKADVVPEVVRKKGHWLFVNFHYPNAVDAKSENLLGILDVLLHERQAGTK